jgi:Domain of unknown function (DUF4252)
MRAARRSALLALCLLLPACATQPSAPKVPSLAAMQSDAVDSVNITLGPVSLGFLSFISRFGGEHDPNIAAARSLLHGLHKVQVHNFEFAADHTYRQSDLEAIRSQLAAPDWRHIVEVWDRAENESVDIYCTLDNHKLTGLLIVAAEPREFTVVNIVGTIDLDQIAGLRQSFVSHDRTSLPQAVER